MGSLTIGLEVHAGQTLLIRGGTSSIGMTTARLAIDMGLAILSTTRNPNKRDKLKANGVDHVIIDDGDVAGQYVRTGGSNSPSPLRRGVPLL
jgi:NADPH:quinone reductase-like Zn-dependent oxidoreductase